MAFVMNASDAKRYIQENGKNLYAQTNALANKEIATMDTSLSDAINEAYTSYKKNEFDTLNTPFTQEYKDNAIKENFQILQDAYNTYRTNYNYGIAEIQNNTNKQISAITKQMDIEAEKTALYDDAHYAYLEYLYNNKTDIFDAADWNKYLTNELSEEGEVIGNRLKTRDELRTEFTVPDGDSYKLNVLGTNFYDQMENEMANINPTYSWNSWLKSQKALGKGDYKDLYDWSTEQSLLDWAPNKLGTANLKGASFKKMVGLASSDEEYKFIERWGGLNETQIKSMFSKYEDKVTELQDLVNKKGKSDAKSIATTVSSYINEIKTVVNDLGLGAEFSEDYWNKLQSNSIKYIDESKTNGEMTGDWFSTFGTDTTIGTTSGAIVGGVGGAIAGGVMGGASGAIGGPVGVAAGAGVGATIGGLIIGTVGAAIGTVGGGIGGIVDASIDTSKDRQNNKQLAQQAVNDYRNLITMLTAYAVSDSTKKQSKG